MSRPYSVHRPARSTGDAIRLFCLECQGSSEEFGREDAAVKNCPSAETCSLYPYRFGKDPNRRPKTAEGSLKALAAAREKRSRTRSEAK